jgi:hypothetical protein
MDALTIIIVIIILIINNNNSNTDNLCRVFDYCQCFHVSSTLSNAAVRNVAIAGQP